MLIHAAGAWLRAMLRAQHDDKMARAALDIFLMLLSFFKYFAVSLRLSLLMLRHADILRAFAALFALFITPLLFSPFAMPIFALRRTLYYATPLRRSSAWRRHGARRKRAADMRALRECECVLRAQRAAAAMLLMLLITPPTLPPLPARHDTLSMMRHMPPLAAMMPLTLSIRCRLSFDISIIITD